MEVHENKDLAWTLKCYSILDMYFSKVVDLEIDLAQVGSISIRHNSKFRIATLIDLLLFLLPDHCLYYAKFGKKVKISFLQPQQVLFLHDLGCDITSQASTCLSYSICLVTTTDPMAFLLLYLRDVYYKLLGLLSSKQYLEGSCDADDEIEGTQA